MLEYQQQIHKLLYAEIKFINDIINFIFFFCITKKIKIMGLEYRVIELISTATIYFTLDWDFWALFQSSATFGLWSETRFTAMGFHGSSYSGRKIWLPNSNWSIFFILRNLNNCPTFSSKTENSNGRAWRGPRRTARHLVWGPDPLFSYEWIFCINRNLDPMFRFRIFKMLYII